MDFTAGRMIAGGLAAFGLALLLFNHMEITLHGHVHTWTMGLGPLLLSLGVGGLVDPRVLWAMKARGRHLPLTLHAICGALIVVALLAAVLLVRIYGVH